VISWFSLGRVAVFLRRIARAEERQADALETLAGIATDKFQRTPTTRKAVFGKYDADAILQERILRGEVDT
jgi:hypothetical protein